MWADDVDVLGDVRGLSKSEGGGEVPRSKSRQQKVIVDAWGHPLTHRPTPSDYPMGSGDYDTPVPKDPNAHKAKAHGDESEASPAASTNEPADGDEEDQETATATDAARAHDRGASAMMSGAAGEERDAGNGAGRAAVDEGLSERAEARASALRAAADAAEAVARAAEDGVDPKLMRTLEDTAEATEVAAEKMKATQPPQLLQTGKGKYGVIAVAARAKIAHSKLETGSPRKLPWRKDTADFHNHMNGRVHPRDPHPAEQEDIRGKHIKTSERPTPFTGWGLQRDRHGKATEIGFGGGFHGGGHNPTVDSRTLPMGGTAERPWKASVDDAAPPSPRLWTWQGLTDPEEDAVDMRRQSTHGAYPDSPEQGWGSDAEATWREQDPEEQSYTWQLGRGLGGRDEEPLDE